MVGQCPSEVLAPADGLPEIRQGGVSPLASKVKSSLTTPMIARVCHCRSTPGNVARMLGGDNSIYSRSSPQRTPTGRCPNVHYIVGRRRVVLPHAA